MLSINVVWGWENVKHNLFVNRYMYIRKTFGTK